jgi:hypothetical protein
MELTENYSDNSEDSEYHEDDENYEVQIPLYYRKEIAANENSTDSLTSGENSCVVQNMLSSPDVASALDRINLSDRKFTILAAAIARANNEDLHEVSLSRSSIKRKRKYHRSTIHNHIREKFSEENVQLVVHWDTKIMNDSTTSVNFTSNTDRLAVVVTGCNVEKILGIVKIPVGTGDAQAKATHELLSLWEVSDNVVAMGFDTTATNTGHKKGACIILEKLLGRKLLHLPCRHHIHEIIISEVFRVLFGASTGPTISLFERFKKFWRNVDPSLYHSMNDARLESAFGQELRQETLVSLKGFLRNDQHFARGDYKEMMDLCLLMLDFPSASTSYHFQQPGAYHLARWMAKVIYCLKIYLFRNQFPLTDGEAKNLKEFCLFAAFVYAPSWISCPVASDAPINDLQLLRKIKQYSEINATVSQAAFQKLKNHLWYLCPELIPLSLFSNKVCDQEKKMIVKKMIESGDDWNRHGVKHLLLNEDDLQYQSLHNLVTSASTAASQMLGLDVRILAKNDPSFWNSLPSYERMKSTIHSLSVVNDSAERSIALMSAFNKSITKNESEMQKLIQVVEDNRKRIPDCRKTTLSTNVST